MVKENNIVYKIINEHTNDTLYGNEEKEDINYTDVFYPIIERLIGNNSCVNILDGKDQKQEFKINEIMEDDYNTFLKIIEDGNIKYESNMDSLENIYKESGKSLKYLFQKQMANKLKKGKLNATQMDEYADKIIEVFSISPSIFKSLDKYELSKNNVK